MPWIGLPSIWARTGSFLLLAVWLLLTLAAVAIAAADASSPRTPTATPPDGTDVRAGPGPDPEPDGAASPPGPPRESIGARASWAIPVVRLGAGSAAVALVAVFTAFALAVAPLGSASAAFTARAASTGNSWNTAGPGTRLAFTTDPSDSGATIPFEVQPVVVVLDAPGHIVELSNAPVTLALTTAAGATLTCTANPQRAVAGVATFAGCAVDDAGTYTLTATSGALAKDVSAPFTITTSAATSLELTTDPSSSTGGVAFATQPVVEVQDAGGNTVATSTAPVTLSITAPAGATLTCSTNPKPAVAGVATFAGCRVDKPGTYTLTATSGTLSSDVSADFTITTGPARQLAFTTSPSFSNAGVAFFTQPAVTVRDAGGNKVATSTAPVTLSITTPASATLTCTANPKAAVAGVASFAGCRIDKPGTYTLTATSAGLTSAVSAGFTIAVGSTTKLAFTTSPSSSTGGIPFATQPAVAVQDAVGNTVTSSTDPVTLVLTTPEKRHPDLRPGHRACRGRRGRLHRLRRRRARHLHPHRSLTRSEQRRQRRLHHHRGASREAGLHHLPVQRPAQHHHRDPARRHRPGRRWKHGHHPRGLDHPGHHPTHRWGIPDQLLGQPEEHFLGGGHLQQLPSERVGHLHPHRHLRRSHQRGQRELHHLLRGRATGLQPQPLGHHRAGSTFSTQPRVVTQNAAGGNVTNPVTAITLTLTPPSGGAVLTCTKNPVNTSSGSARFSGCRVDTPGTYTLTATATGLASAVSTSFTITAAPSKLAFTTSPSSSTTGTTFGTQPVVAIQDASGNATTATNTVTLTITNPAGATLTCTTNPKAATSGIAAFTGCRINRAGTYTLTATASGLSSAVSASFTISP